LAITPEGYSFPGMHRDNKAGLLARLNRVEGQVRGITRMIEDGRYCIDVLTQINAARAALAKVESEMLKTHLNHCIEGAIASGEADDQRAKARELIELLERRR
jgi:CsoR family transcriptional regulator, copper-sensing transcriptional repressor